MLILKPPTVAKAPEQGTMVEIFDCWGNFSTGEDHDATDEISTHTSIRSGKMDIWQNDFKLASVLFLGIKREASSRFFREGVKFSSDTVFTASGYQKPLLNSRACQKMYVPGFQEEPISMQMSLRLFCVTQETVWKCNTCFIWTMQKQYWEISSYLQ